jgi:hypothetical protein
LHSTRPRAIFEAMSDEPDNIMLILLRRIDERTARLEDRLATMERRLALRDQESAIDRADLLALSGRVARIERRLDLADS